MKEFTKSTQSEKTGKAVYMKPAMRVYEMEVEDAVLAGNGSGTLGGSTFGEEESSSAPRSRGVWGDLWATPDNN